MLKDSEIGNIAAIGPAGHPPCSKYERLIADAKQVRAPAVETVTPENPVIAARARRAGRRPFISVAPKNAVAGWLQSGRADGPCPDIAFPG